jgi:hypothetical protein
MGEVLEFTGHEAQEAETDRLAYTSILEATRSREYRAFGLRRSRQKGRVRLFFLPKAGHWRSLDNSHLWSWRVSPDGTEYGLIYHSAGVFIAGSGLVEAALAVDHDTCLFLQEFNPERHDPVPVGTPIITGMRFFTRAADEMEARATTTAH